MLNFKKLKKVLHAWEEANSSQNHVDKISSLELEEFYGLGYKIISKNGYNANMEQNDRNQVKYIPYFSKQGLGFQPSSPSSSNALSSSVCTTSCSNKTSFSSQKRKEFLLLLIKSIFCQGFSLNPTWYHSLWKLNLYISSSGWSLYQRMSRLD